ncbi:MAG: hypothetical protein DRJ52_08835 [Thermoprotei archaeon]|nr:MAG: hypothetical protein DRJ52_08835 [Thermoprotei archaeon]RLE99300.1 MAG: hypothetical protein DRJ63_05790 [Thermoprotei archaeon]
MDELTWEELVKNRSWEDLRYAVKVVLKERKKRRLRGSKRSVVDDVKLAELAALLVEELVEKEIIVLKVLESGQLEIVWNLDKFKKI